MTEQTISETIDTKFKSIEHELLSITKNTKELMESLKTLQKSCKSAQKHTKHKKKIQTKNTLSADLEKFLSVEKGTQLTKAEVMRGISKYIKDKNLQLPENKRQFKADKKLTKIFGMDQKKPLTFVEIGGHISTHLTKI